jgi:TolB-like protein
LPWSTNAGEARATTQSIAVLPFENANGDPNTEYLSDGISEALINSLAELPQLHVIARATAFRYKGKDVDPRRVGRELQVAAVLTGKVRQMQDALNVQVDLVNAATMPKAKESALKAMALDDTAAEPHASLGNVLVNYDWNWAAAEKEFKRSIELKPDYATAHEWYAIHYLLNTGRLEEAVQEMKKALELEPASLIMNSFMGATLYYTGRYDEAMEQCRRTIEMDPNFAVPHWHLGLVYEQKKLFDAAIEEFKKATSLSGGSPLMKAALGRAYAESQKKLEARQILGELNELSKQNYVSSYEVATIYVALGDNEQAFQLLEKAYAEHSFHLIRLNMSPYLKPISSDWRFQDLAQRIGL